MANERQAPQSDIKQLISKGLEQGYLTYAEVNDHLPDDIVDPEQIEDIIGMINDMGITVHEVAPDSDTLILSDAAVSADDEEAEEAAAALAAVDSEFGRTTDPVRMYMREMGTVELLTREGEIELAKRIEEGLDQALSAVSAYPASVAILLDAYNKFTEGEGRLTDIISGFRDNNMEAAMPEESLESELLAEDDDIPADDEDEDLDDEDAAPPTDTGPDPAIAAEMFERLKTLHQNMEKALAAEDQERIKTVREEISNMFLAFKFNPKIVDEM